jgi:hypothetical protein
LRSHVLSLSGQVRSRNDDQGGSQEEDSGRITSRRTGIETATKLVV